MNMLAPPRQNLAIEVIFDLVCPWCYLGTRRLLRVLRRHPAVHFDLFWRPFLLNPDMPRGGVPRHDYLARKFGNSDRADRMQTTIAGLGRQEGIEFRFDRISHTPSSVDAHRLVALAAQYGQGWQVMEALFAAHFHDGDDIGDTAALWRIGSGAGLPPGAVRQLFSSDTGIDQIHHDNLRAHRIGVNGVPCFIFGNRHAVAGAQEAEVFERLIDVAMTESTAG